MRLLGLCFPCTAHAKADSNKFFAVCCVRGFSWQLRTA